MGKRKGFERVCAQVARKIKQRSGEDFPKCHPARMQKNLSQLYAVTGFFSSILQPRENPEYCGV